MPTGPVTGIARAALLPVVVGTLPGCLGGPVGVDGVDGVDETAAPTASAVGVVAAGCGLVERVGTGVVIEHDGRRYIATVAHTVAGASEVTVIDSSDTRHPATVVGFDSEDDLAILASPAIDGEAGPRGDDEARSNGEARPGPAAAPLGVVEAGEPAAMVTWRPGDGFTPVPTRVTRLLRVTIEDIYIEGVGERRAIEIEAPVAHGDSGAPVLSRQGDLLGIVYARSRDRPNTGFAIAATELEDVLSTVDGAAVGNSRCI